MAKYDASWVGIDAGREGLWREPIWTRVVELVAEHASERVYDRKSPIYASLIAEFPDEKWCSLTPEKTFRPLFRDYAHPWTRSGVVSLHDQRFQVTAVGEKLLAGELAKEEILVDLFVSHVEATGEGGRNEAPFAIVAEAFGASPRPLTAAEVYWMVMKNYRPGRDDIEVVLQNEAGRVPSPIPETPFRRVKHMLQLLKDAGALQSDRRGHEVFWAARDENVLGQITRGAKANLESPSVSDAQGNKRYKVTEDQWRRPRDLAGVETRAGVPNARRARMRLVPVETATEESFPVSAPDSEPRLAKRLESVLVEDFTQWLATKGLESHSARYTIRDCTLRSDIFISEWNLLVEAKATSSRGNIRTAIGQLFDYRRFHDLEPRLAVLVPGEPEEDLLELLRGLGVQVWFRDGDGFASKPLNGDPE